MAGGFGLLVVRIDVIEHALLGLKVARENLDRDGVCLVRIPQRGQIVVVGELRRLGIAHHERAQVLGVHVEMDRTSKGARIHAHGARQVGKTRRHLRRHLVHEPCCTRLELRRYRRCYLLADCLHHLIHSLLQIRSQLLLHIIGHRLLQALGQGIAAERFELGQDLPGCGIMLKICRECGSEL